MPTPAPRSRASENPPLPHVLDLLERRRTRVAWIAVAHALLVAVALAVVWWATRSTGHTTAHANANAWPTDPAPPRSIPSPRPTSAPSDTPRHALPRRTIEPAPQPAAVAATVAPPIHIATPSPPANTQRHDATDPRPGLDIVARVVELPTGQGLLETVEPLPHATSPASALHPTLHPPAAGHTTGLPAGLPPGGVRPPSPLKAVVDWLTAPATDATPTPPQAVLTTGQIQVDVSSNPPDPQTNLITRASPAPMPRDTPIQSTEPAASTSPVDIADIAETPDAELPTEFVTGSFYGLPAGRRTVYLLDASGSLLDTLPFAIEELYRSVRTLEEPQAYAVVFFNGDGVIDAAPGGMQPASRHNLAQTLTWLEPRLAHVRAKGRPDAANALAHALAMQPDTIVLLSDGVTGLRDPAADRRQLVTLLERLGRGVRVHTVQFIDPDPLAARGRLGTLELLASLSSGRHRFVGLQDVQPHARAKANTPGL